MPYKDPIKQAEYQKKWIRKRREEFFADKCCESCLTTENLQLDHIDPKKKLYSNSHAIWSYSKEKRDKELSKCQILCEECHKEKTAYDMKYGYCKHGVYVGTKKHANRANCNRCRREHRDDMRKRRGT